MKKHAVSHHFTLTKHTWIQTTLLQHITTPIHEYIYALKIMNLKKGVGIYHCYKK